MPGGRWPVLPEVGEPQPQPVPQETGCPTGGKSGTGRAGRGETAMVTPYPAARGVAERRSARSQLRDPISAATLPRNQATKAQRAFSTRTAPPSVVKFHLVPIPLLAPPRSSAWKGVTGQITGSLSLYTAMIPRFVTMRLIISSCRIRSAVADVGTEFTPHAMFQLPDVNGGKGLRAVPALRPTICKAGGLMQPDKGTGHISLSGRRSSASRSRRIPF